MSDKQIYYIHGFGSTAESETLQLLRKSFPNAIGLDYDHNDPAGSIKKLINDIQMNQVLGCHPVIAGSSLGGWYAEQLTQYIVADFILYNPSTQPETGLARYGLSQEVLFKYKQISSTSKFLPTSRSVLLSEDDEVIDPMIANIKYKHVADVMFTDGGHRMTEKNLSLIVSKIKYLENQIP